MSRVRSAAPWAFFLIAELTLYLSYRDHDARFHWTTHFLVGGAFALAVMVLLAWRRRRPVPLPVLWVLLAHLFAMFPDFLFEAGRRHEWWMDVFLLHIRSHFVPGRNVFWLVVFLAALGAYLGVLDRRVRTSRLR